MPIGFSDGTVYEDEMALALNKPITMGSDDAKSMTHQAEASPDKVQKVVSGLTNQLSDALTAPAQLTKDFYEGKTNSDDPEAIHRAFDVVENVAGLGVTGAESNALGMFGGRMTQGAVSLAESMEKMGLDASRIKRWSGLERGADDMWRREFSDADSKLDLSKMETITNQEKSDWTTAHTTAGPDYKGSADLGDILHHPELYKAYPEAKNIPVVISPHEKNLGTYYSDMEAIALKSGRDEEQMKSTLLHEVQHYIQHQEGFSLTAPSQINPQLADQLKGHYIRKDLSKQTHDVIDMLGQGKEDEARELATRILKHADYKLYRNQASETEARNTQARAQMDAAARRNSLGKDTEDVDRADQIVAK